MPILSPRWELVTPGPLRVRGNQKRTVTLGALAGAFLAAPLWAQEPPDPVPVVVDYVGSEGIYLSIGLEHGVQVGDTLIVLRGQDPGAEVLGPLIVTTASRRRSVAMLLDSGLQHQAFH